MLSQYYAFSLYLSSLAGSPSPRLLAPYARICRAISSKLVNVRAAAGVVRSRLVVQPR